MIDLFSTIQFAQQGLTGRLAAGYNFRKTTVSIYIFFRINSIDAKRLAIAIFCTCGY